MSEKPVSRGTISHHCETDGAVGVSAVRGAERTGRLWLEESRRAGSRLAGSVGGPPGPSLDISLHQFRKVINMDLPPVTSLFYLFTYSNVYLDIGFVLKKLRSW